MAARPCKPHFAAIHCFSLPPHLLCSEVCASLIKLEAINQQKLLNLEELKKSFLQKAVNGEL
jgi:hypothetical protein